MGQLVETINGVTGANVSLAKTFCQWMANGVPGDATVTAQELVVVESRKNTGSATILHPRMEGTTVSGNVSNIETVGPRSVQLIPPIFGKILSKLYHLKSFQQL